MNDYTPYNEDIIEKPIIDEPPQIVLNCLKDNASLLLQMILWHIYNS